MDNKGYIFSLIAVILISACGRNHLDEDIPNPDASPNDSSTVIIPPSSGGSSGAGSGSGSGGGGGSSQGLVFLKKQSIAMSTDETFQGATSDGTNLYFLTEKSLTYPSKQRKIYKIDPASGAKSLHCTWIDSDFIIGGLVVVGQNFYIYKNVYDREFKRVALSGCSQLSNIVGIDSPSRYSTAVMAYNGTDFFWAGRTGGYMSPYALLRVNFSANTVTNDTAETISGNSTTDWGGLKALAVSGTVKYAVFSPSYQNYELWKLSSSGTAVYPIAQNLLDSYNDPSQAAMLGTNTLVLFMSEYYNLRISYFGVGN